MTYISQSLLKNNESHLLTIKDLATAFRNRSLSPVTVIESLRNAIQHDDRHLNAFSYLDWNSAIRDAWVSEALHNAGTPRSMLEGVPVSIKDMINVRGWPTRFGSLTTQNDAPPSQDAPSVENLRVGGAVLFGKTSTTEFGTSVRSYNPHTGSCRNPSDLSRSAGGSSSGAAAQIAAGYGPLAIGSDAGGSIRIPASFCGIVGFKPSFGIVPIAPQSAFSAFAHVGPMTKTVEDAKLALEVLGAPSKRDPSSLFPRRTDRRYAAPRIGWTTTVDPIESISPTMTRAMQRLAAKLSKKYSVTEIDLAAAFISDDVLKVWTSGVFESFVSWTPQRRALLSPAVVRHYDMGSVLPNEVLVLARNKLRICVERLAAIFVDIDILLLPATLGVAPLLAPDEETGDESNPFGSMGSQYLFNLSQQPALVIPFEREENDLPLGLQIVGRRFDDERVLDFGVEIEANRSYVTKSPSDAA
jgi:Asp-tRNA(Asn)/Glu-tRNA(Gln) amidotransferase A subunit family amidase